MLPHPLKKKKLEEPADDIPEVLQGEIARLDQRFKVQFSMILLILTLKDIFCKTIYIYSSTHTLKLINHAANIKLAFLLVQWSPA